MRDGLLDRLAAAYPDTAEAAGAAIRSWLSGEVPLVDGEALRAFLDYADLDEIHDSFWRRVPFGTGGVRGTVGFGPNRINPTTVGFTIQAHCTFLDQQGAGGGRILIANDVRAFTDLQGIHQGAGSAYLRRITSKSLAALSARIYLANGFEVYAEHLEDPDSLLTTPELSFMIRHAECVGGINLSASHNPPDDNGVKVYAATGGQYLSPQDDELATMAAEIAGGGTLDRIDDDWDTPPDGVQQVPGDWVQAYQDMYGTIAKADGLLREDGGEGTRFVFTPLNGCAERNVVPVMEAAGYPVVVPPGQGPDPTFASIPFLAPNPEVIESTQPARAFAEEQGLDVVLSSDPDGDRVGIDVRDPSGTWVHLTGNELATVIAYFLYLDPAGPGRRGLMLKSMVTTLALDAIAERAGVELEGDLLVGFKHVAEELRTREESTGGPVELGLAVEESHGVMLTASLRDKDAVSGTLVLGAVQARREAAGGSVLDYLDVIESDIGAFADVGRSVVLRGSAGHVQINDAMRELRSGEVRIDTGGPWQLERDFWDTDAHGPFKSETDRVARNILVFRSRSGQRLTFRPSGTEPKLKFYLQARATPDSGIDRHALTAQLTEQANDIYVEIAAASGVEVNRAFAALPDLIDVRSKGALEGESMTLLTLQDPTEEELESALAGIQDAAARLVPGSDPVTSVVEAIRVTARDTGDPAAEHAAAWLRSRLAG